MRRESRSFTAAGVLLGTSVVIREGRPIDMRMMGQVMGEGEEGRVATVADGSENGLDGGGEITGGKGRGGGRREESGEQRVQNSLRSA